MSTSTDPVRQRMAAANPARPEAEPPGEVMNATVLLDMIDERSGAMTHKLGSQEQEASVVTRRIRGSWAVAFAAGFVAVLIVGVSLVLLSREGDSLNVIAPVTTSSVATPTTTAPPATTIPVAGQRVAATWSLEATYDTWLASPISYGGGYAAIQTFGPDWQDDYGGVWLSPDGVQWRPASNQLPTAPASLASNGETLFAEAKDGIWATGDGAVWRSVLTKKEDYSRLLSTEGKGVNPPSVVAGAAGVVVFGVDIDGRIAGWVYDGDRFVLADVGEIADLSEESAEIKVVVLDDRILLYYYERTEPTFERYMKISFSTSGRTWSDPVSPPENSPLALPANYMQETASADGLNLASMAWGYGLWATDDGSSWEEIELGPADNGWVPIVAGGDAGWIVFSPPYMDSIDVASNTAHAGPEYSNLGLWHSSDARSWAELDDSGPFTLNSLVGVGETGVMYQTFLVGDDDILVFTVVGENQAFGRVGNPRTEVWRLEIDR